MYTLNPEFGPIALIVTSDAELQMVAELIEVQGEKL